MLVEFAIHTQCLEVKLETAGYQSKIERFLSENTMQMTFKIVLTAEALTIFIFNFSVYCQVTIWQNSLYQNVPQSRPFFKRNNLSLSTDFKIVSQTTCYHLILRWRIYDIKLFSSIDMLQNKQNPLLT